MALSWDLSKVSDERTTAYPPNADGSMNVVTWTIIMTTPNVGMNTITEENQAEFYARLKMVEMTVGHLWANNDGPQKITPQDVKAHIGLRTNARPYTKAVWLRELMGYELDTLMRQYKRSV